MPISRCRRLIVVPALTTIALAACTDDDSQGDSAGEVVVFAAASLTEAFTEVGAAFEGVTPGSSVIFSFASSSQLAAQIAEGAPADVLATADTSTMDAAASEVIGPTVFATNRASIVVAPGNPLGIGSLTDLADPALVLVTCAPEAPCGAYAEQIFAAADVAAVPDSYEQNVKAVVTKVALGEADAGIAYATDVAAAGDRVSGVAIPDGANVVAQYPIAVTTEATNPELATTFVDFVLGGTGRRILTSHGFVAP